MEWYMILELIIFFVLMIAMIAVIILELLFIKSDKKKYNYLDFKFQHLRKKDI